GSRRGGGSSPPCPTATRQACGSSPTSSCATRACTSWSSTTRGRPARGSKPEAPWGDPVTSEFEFDAATIVEPAGDGRFRTEITDRWNIGNAPNGGYLVSVVLSAVRASVRRPDPVAVS